MEYLEGKKKVPESGPLQYLPEVLMLISNTLWVVCYIFSNEHHINFIELTLIRGICGLIINWVICKWRGYDLTFKNRHNFRVDMIRSTILTFHGFLIALAQYIIPLPIVHTINCSGVMVIFFLDYLLNGISVNRYQISGITVGFLGVILNSNGSYLTSFIDPQFKMETKFENYMTQNPLEQALFGIFFFTYIWAWAYAIIIIKELRNENSFQSNYFNFFLMTLLSGLCFPLVESKCTLSDYILGFIYTGIPITISQLMYIGSYSITKEHGTVSMINFIAVAVAYFISIFRYKESPSTIPTVGVIMVCIGVYITIFTKDKQ